MIRTLTLALLLAASLTPAAAAAQDADDAALRAEEARLDAEEEALRAEEARLDAEEAALAGDGPPGQRAATPEEQAEIDAVRRRLEASEPTYASPAADPAPVHTELRPVFEQFGGEAGLTALMETFMAELVADPRIGSFFANSDQTRVKRQLVEQFCAILGGGCAYGGRDMRETHQHLGIDRADFNRLVELLQVAMDKHQVPFAAQNKLLAVLAPMHREVVTE
jgi:hemoglobin